MSDIRKEKIVCPHVILCEGRDELRFLSCYKKERGKTDERFESDIQIINFGGKPVGGEEGA